MQFYHVLFSVIKRHGGVGVLILRFRGSETSLPPYLKITFTSAFSTL
jgi:hypothetical protein